MSRRTSSVIPGFGLTLGFTLTYLALIVLIPLGAMLLFSLQLSADQWWALLNNRQLQFSLKLSFGTALAAALLNGILGTIIAWVLVLSLIHI